MPAVPRLLVPASLSTVALLNQPRDSVFEPKNGRAKQQPERHNNSDGHRQEIVIAAETTWQRAGWMSASGQ